MQPRVLIFLIVTAASARGAEVTIHDGAQLIVRSELTTATEGISVRSGGELQIDGTVIGPVEVLAGGTLSVGGDEIASAQLNGALTLHGTLSVQAGNSSGAPVRDHLTGITSLGLGGTLDLQLIGDAPTAGQSFDFWDASSTTGSAPTLTGSAAPDGLFYHTWSLPGDGTLWVGLTAESYAQWATAHGAGVAEADINNDGTPNLLEYALAIDPDGGGNTLPGFDLLSSESGQALSLSFDLPVPCPPAVTYSVEVSDDLVSWQTIAERSGKQGWTGTATVVSSEPAIGFQAFQISDVSSTGTQRFIRLRVVE